MVSAIPAIVEGCLYFDYNYLDGVHYIQKSPRLPKGKTELKFKFNHAGNFAGTGELFVNGEKVDEVDMPRTHPATFSLSEAFDVGLDTGTQVSKLYTSEFPFQGDLDKVFVELIGETEQDPEAELATEEGN